MKAQEACESSWDAYARSPRLLGPELRAWTTPWKILLLNVGSQKSVCQEAARP